MAQHVRERSEQAFHYLTRLCEPKTQETERQARERARWERNRRRRSRGLMVGADLRCAPYAAGSDG
jgi:hypothetical protein